MQTTIIAYPPSHKVNPKTPFTFQLKNDIIMTQMFLWKITKNYKFFVTSKQMFWLKTPQVMHFWKLVWVDLIDILCKPKKTFS